ncbi:hypothetical protein LAZ67_1000144 [Cordylochernes scorpioides]|uniref:Mos1 transposase HTH domain-containing protein n=1 Tax=Cordylochernes scorpioides TaxID=51811 RepID=A0ABY6JX21_9ARAC|nr:hypothetical protein LAZ67_1000144 [Cordylochernes scorpioides]
MSRPEEDFLPPEEEEEEEEEDEEPEEEEDRIAPLEEFPHEEGDHYDEDTAPPQETDKLLKDKPADPPVSSLGCPHCPTSNQPPLSSPLRPLARSPQLRKAPEGETQPSTQVDLFISTEKVLVLNTDLKVRLENGISRRQKSTFSTSAFLRFHRGQKAAEAARDICNINGKGVIGERAAQIWFAKFKNGDLDLEDTP